MGKLDELKQRKRPGQKYEELVQQQTQEIMGTEEKKIKIIAEDKTSKDNPVTLPDTIESDSRINDKNNNEIKEEVIVEVKKEENVDQKTNESAANIDLSYILNKKNEREAENKTYYLDKKVIQAVQDIAFSQSKSTGKKVSESNIVNDILSHVLKDVIKK